MIIKSGWSIVYIDGSQVINFKIMFLSLKIYFVLANSADPGEMLVSGPQWVSYSFHQASR